MIDDIKVNENKKKREDEVESVYNHHLISVMEEDEYQHIIDNHAQIY